EPRAHGGDRPGRVRQRRPRARRRLVHRVAAATGAETPGLAGRAQRVSRTLLADLRGGPRTATERPVLSRRSHASEGAMHPRCGDRPTPTAPLAPSLAAPTPSTASPPPAFALRDNPLTHAGHTLCSPCSDPRHARNTWHMPCHVTTRSNRSGTTQVRPRSTRVPQRGRPINQ